MIYHVALDMACEEIAELCGTCPYDRWDIEVRDCANECKHGIEADCWKRYFLKKIDDKRG